MSGTSEPLDFCGVLHATSQSHCTIPSQAAQKASDKMFENELKQLNSLDCWCVALSAHDVSNFSIFLNPHDAITFLFIRRIIAFFCVSFSSAFVEFVNLFVSGFVLLIKDWLLCEFS